MAKIKRGIIQLSGKVAGLIHVVTRNGNHTRTPVEPGSKKDEPALKKNYKRTGLLNKLASEINKAIKDHSGNLKAKMFYQDVLSRLRKEPLDKRYLLLLQLQDMEVNTDYPLSRLGAIKLNVDVIKNKAIVTVKMLGHPLPGKYNANFYFFEVLMIVWYKGQRRPSFERQTSTWIEMDMGKPTFEFEFPKPSGGTQWLVCLRQRLGVNEILVDAFEGEGMRIEKVGSFDKKEQKAMNSRLGELEEIRKKNPRRKKEEEPNRIKPKRIDPE